MDNHAIITDGEQTIIVDLAAIAKAQNFNPDGSYGLKKNATEQTKDKYLNEVLKKYKKQDQLYCTKGDVVAGIDYAYELERYDALETLVNKLPTKYSGSHTYMYFAKPIGEQRGIDYLENLGKYLGTLNNEKAEGFIYGISQYKEQLNKQNK